MSQFLPNRRAALASALALPAIGVFATPTENKPKGNIKQSICRWCYSRFDLPKLCAVAKKIGYSSIELLSPAEYKTVKEAGLSCAMIRCASIENGLNRTANHERIAKELTEHIDFAASEGLPNVICMSGNRRGLNDEEGIKTCVIGLKKVIGHAEKKKVNIVMEGLNSKVDHKDYMYDKTAWGVALCQALGSPNFKLLYDIYHMQIMEGDVIRTIRTHKEYIGHYHTGGCPGRNEIDETQELYYPAIVKAIVETGYQGYLGQEFIPKKDPIQSLTAAFQLCDV